VTAPLSDEFLESLESDPKFARFLSCAKSAMRLKRLLETAGYVQIMYGQNSDSAD